MAEPVPLRYRLRREMRIRRRADFDRIFREGRRAYVGPLVVRGIQNGLPCSRLGLAVSRRFGPAVKRNSFKRRVREAFRLGQHDLPQGYDLVVSPKPHEVQTAGAYRRMLAEAARRIAA